MDTVFNCDAVNSNEKHREVAPAQKQLEDYEGQAHSTSQPNSPISQGDEIIQQNLMTVQQKQALLNAKIMVIRYYCSKLDSKIVFIRNQCAKLNRKLAMIRLYSTLLNYQNIRIRYYCSQIDIIKEKITKHSSISDDSITDILGYCNFIEAYNNLGIDNCSHFDQILDPVDRIQTTMHKLFLFIDTMCTDTQNLCDLPNPIITYILYTSLMKMGTAFLGLLYIVI